MTGKRSLNNGVNFSKMSQFNPSAKLLTHGDRVTEWLKTGRTGPILVEISPTGFCNAQCPWCSFNGKKSKEKINHLVLRSALIEMAAMGLKAVNWTGGGEPSIYPHFADVVKLAHELGLEQGLFTNGYQELPHQEFFSWIRVSITDTGISQVVKPRVPFGVVLNQTAELTLPEMSDYCLKARELGASYFQVRPALTGNFKTQQFIHPPYTLKSFEQPGFTVHITEYKYNEAQKPKAYGECYGFQFVPSIDWNGKVSVCLYRTLEEDYILGDINTRTFKEIWASMPASVPATDACWNCCKNHEINKALFEAKNVEQRHFL